MEQNYRIKHGKNKGDRGEQNKDVSVKKRNKRVGGSKDKYKEERK